jgi:ABC-type lipoprotein release transport system permease subunit
MLGVALGVLGALLVARWLTALLFGVTASDPGVLAMTAVVLVVVAALASVVPAWRAMRVDPVSALRTE